MQLLSGYGNCQQTDKENQGVSPLKPFRTSRAMTNCVISEPGAGQKRSRMVPLQLWEEAPSAGVRPDFLIVIISGIQAAQSTLMIIRIGW
jgi:hypothetical protein